MNIHNLILAIFVLLTLNSTLAQLSGPQKREIKKFIRKRDIPGALNYVQNIIGPPALREDGYELILDASNTNKYFSIFGILQIAVEIKLHESEMHDYFLEKTYDKLIDALKVIGGKIRNNEILEIIIFFRSNPKIYSATQSLLIKYIYNWNSQNFDSVVNFLNVLNPSICDEVAAYTVLLSLVPGRIGYNELFVVACRFQQLGSLLQKTNRFLCTQQLHDARKMLPNQLQKLLWNPIYIRNVKSNLSLTMYTTSWKYNFSAKNGFFQDVNDNNILQSREYLWLLESKDFQKRTFVIYSQRSRDNTLYPESGIILNGERNLKVGAHVGNINKNVWELILLDEKYEKFALRSVGFNEYLYYNSVTGKVYTTRMMDDNPENNWILG